MTQKQVEKQLDIVKKYFPHFKIEFVKLNRMQPQLKMSIANTSSSEFLLKSEDLLVLAIKCSNHIYRQLGREQGIVVGQNNKARQLRELLLVEELIDEKLEDI